MSTQITKSIPFIELISVSTEAILDLRVVSEKTFFWKSERKVNEGHWNY
jgi:hypothetical protein